MSDEEQKEIKPKRKPPRRKTTYECRTLRMSTDEKAELDMKAAEAEKSVNQFILDCIKSAKVQKRPTESLDLRAQNIWLNRINANLNMLAKWGNVYKENADVQLIELRLAQIRNELNAYFYNKRPTV